MKFVLDKTNEQTIYKYYFSNLADLYNYLNNNPEINSAIFKEQNSIEAEIDFAGESLDKALEYLKGGYKVNLKEFNMALNSINELGYRDEDSRKLVRSLHGGAYLSPLVAAGIPDCMIRYDRDTTPKCITIYFQINYTWKTTPKQIFNRGIATINLIQALQEKGYLVDLKVFELLKCDDEFIDIIVNVKNIDEDLNITKCYYPLVSKEFFRRVMFRVIESAPVKNNWSDGYGFKPSEEEIRKFYKLKEKDLLISEPYTMGIKGENIYKDTINMFESLNVSNEFDLTKVKRKRL